MTKKDYEVLARAFAVAFHQTAPDGPNGRYAGVFLAMKNVMSAIKTASDRFNPERFDVRVSEIESELDGYEQLESELNNYER